MLTQPLAQREPVLPDVGVIALIPDSWDSLWQPRHQVLIRLARFFSVVWVEPSQEWREMLADFRGGKSLRGPKMALPNFTVYPPESWPPRFYRPQWLADWAFRKKLQKAKTLLKNRGCKKTILYLWRPEFASALESVSYDLSFYHIDDEYSFSNQDLPTSAMESSVMRDVDQVFIHSRAALEKKGSINPHSAFIPNGVDFQGYANPVPEPTDLKPVPHPRIGYTGYLKKQLDWPLLVRLAQRHPQWSFVFVGPQKHGDEIRPFINELSRFSNVYFLGSKSPDVLATYPQHFDVSIMPYHVDGYTKYIYPLKLHEYLAAGRPAVGARIAALEDFSDIVACPEGEAEWSAAITEALTPAANHPNRRMARQDIARKHDWNSIVCNIAGIMAEHLGPDYRKRFEERANNLKFTPAMNHSSANNAKGREYDSSEVEDFSSIR